jgi:hypothetical protein
MKLVFKFLLQIPLLIFLGIGVNTISDGNLWISALVTIGVLFLYTTSEYLDTDE